MLFDDQNTLSWRQDLAQVAASYFSDRSINVGKAGTIPAAFQSIGSAPRDVGKGRPVRLLIEVVETFTSGGAGTLQAELVAADDDVLATNLVSVEIGAAIALATLVAGYYFTVAAMLPPGIGAKQFIGCRYTIGTATMTAGKVTAGILWDVQTSGV